MLSIVLYGEAKWWTIPCVCFNSGAIGLQALSYDKEPSTLFHVHGVFSGSKPACGGVLFAKEAGWANWCPLVLAPDYKVPVNLIENPMQCP
ncbi:hypothetical protein V6N13_121455 [Hibiscus sabdariffa]